MQGGWVFFFFRLQAKKRESRRGKNMQGMCRKEKYCRGGRGVSGGAGPDGPEMDRVGARIAAWFYCARLRGIRLQNGLGKIGNNILDESTLFWHT